MEKWVPIFIKNEIAGLRHFLPQQHFFGFFLSFFCMGFWRVLVSFWLALGVLQGIFQGLCIQKTWKNNGFLRVYKGIVWFICRLWWRVLCFSVQVCVDFVQKQWSNLGLKSGLEGVQDVTKIGFERFLKKNHG